MCLSRLFSAARVALRESKPGLLASPRMLVPQFQAPARKIFGLIPPNQYENNILPNRLRIGYALFNYWETIPLFAVILFDLIFVVGYLGLYGGIVHRVDTQFSGHNWNCISRNMDLRNPTKHKFLILYQRYEPWPEMQNALDKMKQAEHRNRVRLDSCGYP